MISLVKPKHVFFPLQMNAQRIDVESEHSRAQRTKEGMDNLLMGIKGTDEELAGVKNESEMVLQRATDTMPELRAIAEAVGSCVLENVCVNGG